MTNKATRVAKQTIILHAARAVVDAVGTVTPEGRKFWCLGPAVPCTATYLAAVFSSEPGLRKLIQGLWEEMKCP